MILYLNYQYLAIRKRQAFHTFLVPFSEYSYRKQLSKNTEKTTARADQTTCISVVIETLLKLKNIFFRGFFAGLKEMNLKTRPIYSRSPQLDIQVFRGSNRNQLSRDTYFPTKTSDDESLILSGPQVLFSLLYLGIAPNHMI